MILLQPVHGSKKGLGLLGFGGSSSRWYPSVWWWLVFIGDFLPSIDLKHAYLHNPIHKRHQQLLHFDVNYHFTVLPFGLASCRG